MKFIKKIVKLTPESICIFLGLWIITICLSSCLTEEDQTGIKYKPVTVETTIPTSITYNSIEIGGKISAPQERNDVRGVCWNTLPNPDINSPKKTTVGKGLGEFKSTITGLTANTTYYIRAYAVSALSTVYGNQITVKTTLATTATITTNPITAITTSTAMCGGNVSSDGGSNVSMKGVCWSITSNPTTSNSKTTDGAGASSFSSTITGLLTNTTYYVRAYATNNSGTAYGSQVSFKTAAITVPTLSTNTVSSITTSTALSGGNITSDGGATITSRGVCWSTSSSPTTSNSKTSDGTGSNSYSSSITGLLSNTTYYVRAYATNSAGTAYGSQVSFKTSLTIPALSTTSASSITTSTAISGGSITSDGGATITARGVCWSTGSSPTTSNSKTSNGTGSGSYSSSISGLLSNTTYYVRAYATNSAGTAYGGQVSFKTTAIIVPVLSTTTISSITSSTALGGGNISNDGGGSVTGRGVCWSSSTTSPTISNSTSSNGSGIGSYSCSITGLTANTTYYVRAYATNSAGTSYGSVVSFNSLPSFAIGQSYQGGIIFYVDGTGLHGLISAVSDQSSGIRWYNGSYLTTSATTSSVGYGNTNTNTIVSSQGTGSYAARLCYDLSLNGYSDWFLPSRSELSLMYTNLKSAGLGGFSSVDYWSSTETSSSSAYYQSFSTGTVSTATKSITKYVRAIRAF